MWKSRVIFFRNLKIFNFHWLFQRKNFRKTNLEKNPKIWCFDFFLELCFEKFSSKSQCKLEISKFREKSPEFSSFLDQMNVAAFGWIVLQCGMIFLIQDFLCFEVYTSTLWKKLFGDQCDDKYFCRWIWFFFVTKISEDRFHLLGERDLREWGNRYSVGFPKTHVNKYFNMGQYVF